MSHRSSEKSILDVDNTALQTVTAGASISFNIIGLRKNVKFAPGGNLAILRQSGLYAYSFKVTGTVPAVPNVMCLTVNGVPIQATCSPDSGSGFFKAKKGDAIGLQIDAASPGGNVTLDSGPLNGAATASLTLALFER